MTEKRAFIGFAGFGGVEIALRRAGFKTIGVEIRNDVALVNWFNGGNVIVADILNIDPVDYIGFMLMHFSPPCPNFSQARQSAKQNLQARLSDFARYQRLVNGETETDMALAHKICEFIRVSSPEHFTLENVWQYRKSLSWLTIWYTLRECDYRIGVWNLNAAEYGVPQTRRRMVVIARRDGKAPAKPWQTHSKMGDMFTKPWVGWFEVIEDLIPSLPLSEFARWQKKALPDNLMSFIIGNGNRSSPKTVNDPMDTITSNHNQLGLKAFIVGGADGRGMAWGLQQEGKVCGQCDMFTVTAGIVAKNTPPKAFVVGGQYQTPNNSQSRTVQNRIASEPIWTVIANENNDTRVWLNEGYVVLMTPRCLARFQSFPNWFELPENRALACYGIGNAVPPLLYDAILKSIEMT